MSGRGRTVLIADDEVLEAENALEALLLGQPPSPIR